MLYKFMSFFKRLGRKSFAGDEGGDGRADRSPQNLQSETSAFQIDAGLSPSESKKILRHFDAIKNPRKSMKRTDSEIHKNSFSNKSSEQQSTIIKAIKHNILFQNCSEDTLRKVTQPMRLEAFEAGKVIIRQGDTNSDDFYVCIEGVCEVTKTDGDEEILRFDYKALPQAFGELALLYQAPRAATVTAKTDVKCWVLHYQDFQEILHSEEGKARQAREAVMKACSLFNGLDHKQQTRIADSLVLVNFQEGEIVDNASSHLYVVKTGTAIVSAPHGPQTIQHGETFGRMSKYEGLQTTASRGLSCYALDNQGCNSLANTLKELNIFRSLSKVPLLMSIGKEQLIELTPKFSRVKFRAGEYVIREGEVGDAFFVVESGKYRVMHQGKSLLANDIEAGQCFGEASLLSGQSNIRQADVVTIETGMLMRLAKADFVEHLGHLEDVKNMWRMVALRKTRLLRELRHDSMLQVAKALSREVFHAGQVVIKQGDIGDKFYIIENGNCDVIGSSGQVLNRIESGTPFGEAALLTASKRTATVKVSSPQCYLLSLNRGDFYSLLGGLMAELKESAAQYITDPNDLETFDPKEVKWVRPFGAGAYSIVYLGWWKDKLYAIKAINKKHMIDIKQVNEVIAEKAMLQGIQSDFCIQLVATAQDSRNLYMMMDPLLGGELFTLVAEKLGPLPEDKARFYAACTVLGLEYLHSNNILYRDLKLENLLIDSRGYLKVADLGIAKKLQPGQKTYTFRGTPDYMAPEYLTSSGVTHSADWWALGVLLFEMNAGYTPFQADEPMDMFRKITHVVYKCPNTFSPQLQSLISGLLEKHVSRRLGSGVTGALEVKQHPWFKGLDWNALKDRKIPAPWLPDIDIRRTSEIPEIYGHPVTKGERITNEQQALFADF